MTKFRKLIFFVLYLLLFSTIAFRVKLFFFSSISRELLVIQTLIFVFLFGYFMWQEAISNIFHLYLRYSRKLALKNINLATSMEVVLTFLFFVGFGGFSSFQWTLLTVDPICFLFSFLVMYYWVASLSYRDFFVSNTLIFANKKFWDKSMLWIKDPRGKKNFVYFDDTNLSSTQFESILIEKRASEVVIVKTDFSKNLIDLIIRELKNHNIGYFLIENEAFWKDNDRFDQQYLVRGYTNRDSLLNVSIKRIIDVLFSLIALFLLLPVFVLVFLLIKAEDGGPVFYVSKRIGKNGREINFIKFRSMVVNAEKLKSSIFHLNERPEGPLFKMKNDPRVTRIGRILRKYSIDELPQFINVFKGDLSLVGPRPHLASEVAHYKGFQYQRMDCIPGITCLAQIKDRNGLSLDKWIQLDLKYRNEWNFKLDFLILAKTVKMIFKGV